MSEDYGNECGAVIGKITIKDFLTIGTQIDDKEIRGLMARIISTMIDSNEINVYLVFDVRGKKP